jgi:DNA-binding transcriptional LysR family regulator
MLSKHRSGGAERGSDSDSPLSTGMLDKLNFLIALAQEQHFGRATEACGITQPTLSAGIKQLEGIVDVLLVPRGSRFLAFTPEGQAHTRLEWARRIVGDARAMRLEISALKHGLAGQIKIAAVPTALAMVAAVRQAPPQCHGALYFRSSARLLDLRGQRQLRIAGHGGGGWAARGAVWL